MMRTMSGRIINRRAVYFPNGDVPGPVTPRLEGEESVCRDDLRVTHHLPIDLHAHDGARHLGQEQRSSGADDPLGWPVPAEAQELGKVNQRAGGQLGGRSGEVAEAPRVVNAAAADEANAAADLIYATIRQPSYFSS
jgi:hypothetical protein